ncbi:MAG: hypothetical protein R2734_19730 [Nocardioides sp.]
MPRLPRRPESPRRAAVDAQVAYHCDRLTGAVGADPGRASRQAAGLGGGTPSWRTWWPRGADRGGRPALRTVPSSAAASALAELVAGAAHAGPGSGWTLGELVERDRFGVAVGRPAGAHPVVEQAVNGLADVPLVGTVASRFMGRVVGEVLQANRAVAGCVPGLGPLMLWA